MNALYHMGDNSLDTHLFIRLRLMTGILLSELRIITLRLTALKGKMAFSRFAIFVWLNTTNNAECKRSVSARRAKAAVKTVESVDECVGRVVNAATEMGGAVIITADHGNADCMVGEDGNPFTPHTINPVSFCVVGYPCELRNGGRIADIAPLNA